MSGGPVVGILQPGYLPWLGFFEQLSRCDIFVLYDDVPFDRHGWRNRNRVKTAGGTTWLTVPVLSAGAQRPLVKDVRIDNRRDWRMKHRETLRQSYARAPYFDRYIGLFEEGYAQPWELLVDLDLFFIDRLAEALGLGSRRRVRSSTLGVAGGGRIERLLGICRRFGASVFYEGAAGRDYIDPAFFADQGVAVRFQEYRHPVYSQLHGAFTPYLSAVDLLFNHGERSLALLTGETRAEGSA